MIIKLLIEGGNMAPSPAIAQKLGPMGVNIGKVISSVNEATQDFKGINVPVHLDVNPKTKNFTIKVLSPPTSELIKKEAGITKASGDRLKIKVGNLAIEQVIAVAKTKQPNMLARDFISALKSVIGSCLSMGILIEDKDPKEILIEIESGTYKNEIESQKTSVNAEKEKSLQQFFSLIQSKQEAEAKKAEEEKATAEAKKAEAETKPAEKPEKEKK